MWVRWTGLALALVVVGGAGGYALGRVQAEEPATATVAAPLPAASPAYPHTVYDVLPDPKVAPLGTGLRLRTTSFRSGGWRMTAMVPGDWRRAPLKGGGTWNFAPAANPRNAYLLRVGIVAANRVSVRAARDNRINNLHDAAADGNLQHIVVEDVTDDGFTATYLDNGYQRVTMERWLPQHGSTTAYTTIAVTGREVDRAGMADLLERVAASADY